MSERMSRAAARWEISGIQRTFDTSPRQLEDRLKRAEDMLDVLLRLHDMDDPPEPVGLHGGFASLYDVSKSNRGD